MTLFKYLRPDRVDVLQRCEIRFTQPGALNDPFELRPQFEELLAQADLLEGIATAPIDLSERIRDVYSMLPEEQRSVLPLSAVEQSVRAMMTTDTLRAAAAASLRWVLPLIQDHAGSVRQQIFDILNKNVGLLSLSETSEHQLMWAHYAESHSGFVLGFNESHPFFNSRRSEHDECYHLRRVVYSDVAPARTMATIDSDALFVTKAPHWAYEREWRMLVPLRDATRSIEQVGDVIHLFAFSGDAVQNVILGARMTSSAESKIREILKSRADLSHVTVGRAILDHNAKSVRVTMPDPDKVG
jgi:hypothetical protein